MRLLARDALIKTGAVDHADWNFRPILGRITRRRYDLVLRLLPKIRSRRLLELGYGSGVFLPELHRWSDQLYGADIHPHHEATQQLLKDFAVDAELVSASATALPFEPSFFDCIVAVSCLEFVDDLERACLELRRVLTPAGSLVVVTPGSSALLDLGLELLTGVDAKTDFGDRRDRVLPTLARHFVAEQKLTVPGFGPAALRLYTGLRMRPGAPASG